MKRKKHMKRNVVIILIVLGLIGLTLSLTVGGSEQSGALAQESQTATVQRGNLSLEITAAGNLALSRTEDLAIDLFYQEGTIEEVLVEEGDTVEEGQVLVRLDTDEWNDELSILEKAVVTDQRSLTAKQSALTKAERKVTTLEREVADLERQVTAKESAVTDTERQVAAKELAVRQAQLNVETAEYNLSQIDEVKEAQDAVDDAEDNLNFIKMVLADESGLQITDITYWWQLKANAEEDLAYAKEELQKVLDGTSTTISNNADAEEILLEIAKKQLLVEQEQMDLEDAQLDAEDAKQAVEDAKLDVDDAKQAVEDAVLDVEDAKQAVEDAKLDIVDAEQAVEDAQSDLDEAKSLSSVITAPFAGFVTKVNVEGGDEVMKGTVAVQIADPNKFEAEILVSELDIEQVQVGGEALVKVDATGLSLPATVTHIAPTATIQSGVVNYNVTVEVQSVPEDTSLREGMTVTVSLIVAEQQNILLVPYAAIINEGGQKYVQVVSPDGTIEKRAITTGITDYQFTEVKEGLSEGEQILVSLGTTSESTQNEQQPGGMMPMPGMSGPPGPPPGG
jgi:RND family efflux transporter MFP subunit